MKILLIGGTGFVGSYLREYFVKNNYTVDFTSCKSNLGIQYNAFTSNVLDVINEKYDIVINNINPQNLPYNISIKNDESIIEYCKKNNTFLVHISSFFASELNKNESPYNLKKYFSEMLIKQELKESKYAILRFPQIFDSNGLARRSQQGLYYLLESIKFNRPITKFSNFRDCYRNYLPIEIVVNMIQLIITQKMTGVINSHIDSFTFRYIDLLSQIVSLNPNYNTELITVGDKFGLEYAIETQCDQLVSNLDCKNPIEYFKEAYNNLNG